MSTHVAEMAEERTKEANGHYKLASSLQPESEQYRARIRELD